MTLHTMSKTEAADILATKARVLARAGWNDGLLDKHLIEAVITEAAHWDGLYPVAAAAAPSWRTVLRLATADPL